MPGLGDSHSHGRALSPIQKCGLNDYRENNLLDCAFMPRSANGGRAAGPTRPSAPTCAARLRTRVRPVDKLVPPAPSSLNACGLLAEHLDRLEPLLVVREPRVGHFARW